MPASGAERLVFSSSNRTVASPPVLSEPMIRPDRVHGLDQAPERAEEAEKDQEACEVANELAALVEPGGDRIQKRAGGSERQRRPARRVSDHGRHGGQQHGGPGERAAVGAADVVHPPDLAKQADHLPAREHDPHEENAADQRVQPRIAEERALQGLEQDEAEKPDKDQEHGHAHEIDARRGQRPGLGLKRGRMQHRQLMVLRGGRIRAAAAGA
jgi:hypothetical protein